MPKNDPTLWIARLRTAGAAQVPKPPAGIAPWFQVFRGTQAPPSASKTLYADDELWRLLTTAPPDLSTQAALLISTDGPSLLGEASDFGSIELWTECELSALHALSRITLQTKSADLTQRVFTAAQHHIDTTQPDNATNRPWALHVFVLSAASTDNLEADLYAQTLLHNSIIQSGVPDPLSALILADSAEYLAHAISQSAPAHPSRD